MATKPESAKRKSMSQSSNQVVP
uniref:Uncharacterized protein n=1 Tax=Arabidopsis thaliana TaxID=3702 RepID=Q56X49_ARATH|nr:hypothetical protein [Arabidopsis thaliana]